MQGVHNIKEIERGKIRQEWYETETAKTGWDSHGWIFDDGTSVGSDWDVTIYEYDKFGNPISGIAERTLSIPMGTKALPNGNVVLARFTYKDKFGVMGEDTVEISKRDSELAIAEFEKKHPEIVWREFSFV